MPPRHGVRASSALYLAKVTLACAAVTACMALTGLLVVAAITVNQAKNTITETGQYVEADMDSVALNLAQARRDAQSAEIAAIQTGKLAADEFRGDLNRRFDAASPVIASLADSARRDSERITDKAIDTASRADELGEQVYEIIGNVQGITADIGLAMPAFTNCAGNNDCVFERFKRTSGAIEQAAMDASATAGDVRAAVPMLLADTDDVARHAASASDENAELMKHLADATKPLPSWMRFLFPVAAIAGAVGLVIH